MRKRCVEGQIACTFGVWKISGNCCCLGQIVICWDGQVPHSHDLLCLFCHDVVKRKYDLVTAWEGQVQF